MSGIYRPVDPWNRDLEVSAPAKPRPLQTDHIPALRGVIALARGNYATVSPEDLKAAVDAGYVHPDVLAAVADKLSNIAATDELVAGLQNAAQEPTLRSVSDLSFDYQNACLDFVFEDRARWVKLHTWDNAGGSAHVDSYELKQVLLDVAPDLTCQELTDIERAISAWFDETVWDDCATTWGAYIGEIIAARARLRSVRTA